MKYDASPQGERALLLTDDGVTICEITTPNYREAEAIAINIVRHVTEYDLLDSSDH